VGLASSVKVRAKASMVIAPKQVPMGFMVSPMVLLHWCVWGRASLGGYFNGNVHASGNVGIGTVNPDRKVHIVGSGPRILIETTDGFNPEVNFASSGTPDWAIYKHTATGDLRFYQGGDQIIIKNSTGRFRLRCWRS